MLLIRSTLWRVGVQRKVAGCSVYYFFLAVVGQLGRFGLEFRTFIYLISILFAQVDHRVSDTRFEWHVTNTTQEERPK